MSDRRICARLIKEVLAGRRITREALKLFPKSSDDKSVIAAYHALIHYEADEDLAKKDILFKDIQVDFLEGLCNILSQGHDLPENLIRGYNKYHNNVDTVNSTGREYFWHEMKKNLNIYD